MAKYRLVINKDRCTDCGISAGRCPTHARLLARILTDNNEKKSGKRILMGVFSEKDYDHVKKLAEACPEKATIFGDRDELLEEAHRRLREKPDSYVQEVFGEREVGGTSVLYITDISLDFLSWRPNLDDQPLPHRTWAALRNVPGIVFGMGGLMLGAYWVIGRRMKLAMQADANARNEQPDQEAETKPEK